MAAAFSRAEQLEPSPDKEELEADYARFLCVLISGFVERAVSAIILQYAEGSTPAPLRSFLVATLDRVRNVDKARLLLVVGSLDATWRDQLDAFVVDERLAALNSIVGLRNDIAHGGGATVSLRRVRSYWSSVDEVIAKVEELVLTRPPIRGARRR